MTEIGSVSIDIHGKEREFSQLSLSDINVVKWLICFRDKIDIYNGGEQDNYYNHAGNVQSLNQELIAVYVYLDDLICKCNFKPKQLRLIELLSEGNTPSDIGKSESAFTKQGASKLFKNICKKIVEENEREWKMHVSRQFNLHGKKICSLCQSELPSNLDFFGKDKQNKDGLNAKCRKCR